MQKLAKTVVLRMMQILGETCLVCNARYFTASGLCEKCIDELPWQAPGCTRCGVMMSENNSQAPVCARCHQNPPNFDHCYCLLGYESEISGKILTIKDFSDFRAARVLGHQLAQMFVAHYLTENREIPEVLLPVPLRNSRIRKRGYNQAMLLAQIIASRFDLPIIADACIRMDSGHSQRGLSAAQRQANAGKMFRTGNGIGRLRNKRVAIIDDVVTTTATINDMSRVLKTGGVKSIDAWALARRN